MKFLTEWREEFPDSEGFWLYYSEDPDTEIIELYTLTAISVLGAIIVEMGKRLIKETDGNGQFRKFEIDLPVLKS